ncbi:MAG: malto-oligosyltrehalose synthase [Gemmataceae bacterium]
MERFVCIHGHFYQPPRENPWLEVVELQDSAHPYHDWNERITAECYAPNAVARIMDGHGRIRQLVNNYAWISFNFGPTLLAWMQEARPEIYRLILDADQESQKRFSGHGSALAQVYNHVILPLANRADKVTQVRWGIRDFEARFGRRPDGMWLAETAVDHETLEVLAEEGVRFTVLAPHQARRVRKLGDEHWIDVGDGKIDTRTVYAQKLPSGRSINLFFFDADIARGVAFERLLQKGENFAQRLIGGFDDRPGAQLVHIATDGESYGHHSAHGDMALAYALNHIQEAGLARLTNYAEFLHLHPPQWEVDIASNTSWSCFHGIERWRAHCGCNSGRAGWNQQWRGPLRQALDHVRDALAPRFQEMAGRYLKDPAAARDAYVDVILDRSEQSLERFFAQHERQRLSADDQVLVRKLLEMSRNLLLMYTSCGWFFDEVSGLESTQILAFAGRALQLAHEVFGESFEADFLAILSEAKSNLRDHADGRTVYEKFVRPMQVSWERITAHYAISSLFEGYDEETTLYCYQVKRLGQELREAGRTRLVLGRASLHSRITGEARDYTFGAVHFGDHNVYAGVRPYAGEAIHRATGQEFAQAFERVDVASLVRLIDRHFCEPYFSLESLFRDEQRRVLKKLLNTNVNEVVDTFSRVYAQQQPIMRFLKHLHVPLPLPYQVTAELLFATDLRWHFGEEDPDPDRLRALVREAEEWGVQAPRADLGYKFSRALGRAAERWRETPEQIDLLRHVTQTIALGADMPFEVDYWKPQNVWFDVERTTFPAMAQQAQAGAPAAREWLEAFVVMGDALGIAVEDLKKKVAEVLTSPTLENLADNLWRDNPLPLATYRLQLTKAFPFEAARGVVSYLHRLGVSDVYTSPVLQAKPGSMHGYDVCHHGRINPELGGGPGFTALAAALAERKMGLILDVVPNHMGVGDPCNVWWLDVLENGPASRYARFFDIDWRPTNPNLESKVLLPILGGMYGTELERGNLRLSFDNGLFWLHYYQTPLPVSPRSATVVLELCLADLAKKVGDEDDAVLELGSLVNALRRLPPNRELNAKAMEQLYREKESVRRRLARLVEDTSAVKASLEGSLAVINGAPAEPRSFDRLDALIGEQSYRPAFWRVATEEINYRRFFDINELAAIRMELPEVFEATHALIFQLVNQGKATGLRIDHPDGLRDPAGYFRSLQRAYFLGKLRGRIATPLPESLLEQQFERLWSETAANGARKPLVEGAPPPPESARHWPCYVVAEKILSEEEPLPLDWAVAGTVGYDFLVSVNSLFVARENEEAFDRIYRDFSGEQRDFIELVYDAKKRIMQIAMAGEINSLAQRLDNITERNRHYRDFTLNNLRHAIREVIAALPVYRTYVTGPGQVAEHDRRFIELTVHEAKSRNPGTAAEIFDFLQDVLLLRNLNEFAEEDRDEITHWVLRFQQMTGPIMAKGVEDTAFYVYNRLVTLNEVGGHPERFGLSVAAFHGQNQERSRRWPSAMLSSSTHDTKRSEDIRARLNALSELPDEWEEALTRWRKWHAGCLTDLDGKSAPSANDRYLLYQTLLGAWPVKPMSADEYRTLRDRIAAYMTKATREAKVYTSWVNPNEAYDKALQTFIQAILPDGAATPFLQDLDAFARRLAYFGFLNGLAQTTLKFTCPGVPDIYQGCEIWDFSLVDPDNRRPVDFERRGAMLDEVRRNIESAGPDLAPLARQLLDCAKEGKVKLYVVHQLLMLRQRHPRLFLDGAYEPLETLRLEAGRVVAFARLEGAQALAVATPVRVVRILDEMEKLPLGDIWGEAQLLFPHDIGQGTWRNIFTGERLKVPSREGPASLSLRELFKTFPVAVLLRE